MLVRKHLITLSIAASALISLSFIKTNQSRYISIYNTSIATFNSKQQMLMNTIEASDLNSAHDIQKLKQQLDSTRIALKHVDFWLRYLEPLAYKKINSPLPVEWETEVFEKFEKPYKREGAGLTLAVLYLDEPEVEKDSLLRLINYSYNATQSFTKDSITNELKTYHHFFLCNRLFLLNLAAIYTTGFECPDTTRVIPELCSMLNDVNMIYKSYNESFSNNPLPDDYISLYNETVAFAKAQPKSYSDFDHFTFLKDFINPLFILNQKLIKQYHVVSRSLLDYSLNKNCISIFDKSLYNGQNSKGIFLRVKDEETLAEIDRVGKLLFYDPILSGNNLRSCVSCHNPTQHFTDTVSRTSKQFNHNGVLSRNTPSLINVEYNHLLMMDGKHISLQNQTKEVICNAIEMGSDEKEVLTKVLSCNTYNTTFIKLLKHTPQEKEITLDHITSAITFYYSKFSKHYSPFDDAINQNTQLEASVKRGFNLFMSKAQCATCHFVPQFNGVKPPYIGSEFEVLGVPDDMTIKNLSSDKGRFEVNAAKETLHAFRTGTIRNASHTKPYMHNGVFTSLRQVVDFYDAGGGGGSGLQVDNQTLSTDSLHLSDTDKDNLINFIMSLNENIKFEPPPRNYHTQKGLI